MTAQTHSHDAGMAVVNACICGHLDTDVTPRRLLGGHATGPWSEVTVGPEEGELISLLYYEPLVNAMVNRTDASGHLVKMPRIYRGKRQLRLRLDRVLDFRCKDGREVAIRAPHLDLYFMPSGICLWSIKLEYSCPLRDVTWIGLNIREADRPQHGDFRPLLEELYALGRHHSAADLTRTGNKFKIFQHVMTPLHNDGLLFELGCMLPVTAGDGSEVYDTDPEYLERTLEKSRIGVYRSWTALALVDTFTVLATPEAPWNVYFEQNFRYLYLNCIYQKAALTVLNRLFRESDNGGELSRRLGDTLRIERWYGFSQVSYNFLPQLLYEYMDRNMEVAIDRDRLHRYVEEANEAHEKKSHRKLDWVLAFLTLLSISSVLFDSLELARNYAGVEVPVLWRTVTEGATLLGVALLVTLLALLARLLTRRR